MGSIANKEPCRVSENRVKTIDWGTNGIMLSMDQQGTILQLSTYHPKHGIVVLSPFEQFDGVRFYDPSYVRSYRQRMLEMIKENKSGCGLEIKCKHVGTTEVSKDRRQLTLNYDTKEGVHVTRVVALTGRAELTQTTILTTTLRDTISSGVTLNLGMSLNRASYGQLTEGGPIPIPESLNKFKASKDGKTFHLSNPNLEASVEGRFSCNYPDSLLEFDESEMSCRQEPVKAESTTSVKITSGSPVIFTLTLAIRTDDHSSFVENGYSLAANSPCDSSWDFWKLKDIEALTIIRGNLEYVLGNCTVPISKHSTCIITDHVALPLGWNRDNYWQVRFLMDVFQNLEHMVDARTAKEYKEEIQRTVRGHLNWVFRDAQRPHRFWHRSYLATGVPKDGPIFQLDQQCYPVIELCDFFDLLPDSQPFVHDILRESAISEVVDALAARQEPRCKLFPTDETPGDDPVEFPFHFSSHVLLWYTFSRLAILLKTLGDTEQLQFSRLENLARETLAATMHHFVGRNAKTQQTMFAYLTDGDGNHAFYHDANDIPTLFAQEWGFLQSSESVALWRRTMEFGLSSANDGGYYDDGPFGGLGSVHTRGPWPLGYFQELVFAEMQGHEAARAKAWEKIKKSMFLDGLFSEAVDCHTGECTSKAWFSWPGSMIGSALLRDCAHKVLIDGNVKLS